MVCELRNAQQGCGFGIFSDSSLKSLSEMNFAPRGNGNNWNNSDDFGGGYGNGSGGGFGGGKGVKGGGMGGKGGGWGEGGKGGWGKIGGEGAGKGGKGCV